MTILLDKRQVGNAAVLVNQPDLHRIIKRNLSNKNKLIVSLLFYRTNALVVQNTCNLLRKYC